MDIREATAEDAGLISGLLEELGYPATPAEVRKRLAELGGDDRVLICERGFVSLHRIPLLAEGGCLARITALVVFERHRGGGVGRALVGAAEAVARAWGCYLLEVSSGRRTERAAAHRFYPALGFEDSSAHSVRYWKRLS